MSLPSRYWMGMIPLLMFACGGQDDGPGHISTRMGVSTVYEGIAVSDPDCLFRTSESGVCPTWTDLMIQDAAVDGNHVAVLFNLATPSGAGVMLAESEDLGKTWTARGFGSPPTNATQPSLYLSGGKTYIFWVGRVDAPLGGRPIGIRWLVDDSPTGRTEEYDTGVFGQLIWSADGRARTFVGPHELGSDTSGFDDISWAPGETTPTYGVRCAGVSGCFPSLLTGDGHTYVGMFTRVMNPGSGNQPIAACTYTSAGERTACVPWDTWPAKDAPVNDPPSTPIDEGGGVWAAARLYEQNGHAYVTRVVASTTPSVGPVIDLDAGHVPKYGDLAMYASYRSRFPGMTGVIRDGGYMELYRLRGIGGIDRVVFPDSPCKTLESCAEVPFIPGHGQATFLLPLGNDDALVFYVVDTYLGDASNHQFIYASKEHITYEELAAPQEDPNVRYPGWRPASALENMCVRAASCYPNSGIIAWQCAGFWASMSSNAPGAANALATFLATPPGCSGFAQTWPELTVAQKTCPQTCNRCSGDTGTYACLDTAPCGIDCTRRGGTCVNNACSLTGTTAECDSCTGDGRAVSCGTINSVLTVTSVAQCSAGGFSCASGPRCVAAACSSDGGHCDGTTSVQCFSGVESREDCALTGKVCGSGGTCQPDMSAPACAPAGAECHGSMMYTCASDFSRWTQTDCAALGFSTCVKDELGFARCE